MDNLNQEHPIINDIYEKVLNSLSITEKLKTMILDEYDMNHDEELIFIHEQLSELKKENWNLLNINKVEFRKYHIRFGPFEIQMDFEFFNKQNKKYYTLSFDIVEDEPLVFLLFDHNNMKFHNLSYTSIQDCLKNLDQILN